MSLRRGFLDTVRGIAGDFDVFALIVLAVLLYGIYYPAPYAHQHPAGVTLAVVDEEDSALTRALVRRIDAHASVDVATQAPSWMAARALLLERRADGILLIPHGTSRAALRGDPTGIGIWVNGTHLTKAKGIGSAIQEAIRDELGERLQATGLVGRRVLPVEVLSQPMFNPDRGYALYIFPAVTPVILQQTLLFGVAVLLARRRERGPRLKQPRDVLGRWLALTALSSVLCAMYLGWFFLIQDIPRQAALPMLMAICVALAMAMSAFALAIGGLFRDVASALLVLVPTSLPIFFLTGATWPREAMPPLLAWLGGLLPATHGSRAILLADAMGASVQAVARPLALLVLLALGYIAVAIALAGRATAGGDQAVEATGG